MDVRMINAFRATTTVQRLVGFFILSIALIADCWTAFAAERRPRPPRPNVLLIVSDDQRPDTIGALGNDRIRTPNLDSLAAQGTVFTRVVCPCPICVPSRAEIITGCSGFRNRVPYFSKEIDPGLPTWARTMRNAGYHTWYVGKWHNDGTPTQRGYDETQGLFMGGGKRRAEPTLDAKGRETTGYRGWMFRTDDGKIHPDQGVGLTPDISRRFADSAISFINRKSETPFFLHVNFTAPHDPLLMPPGYAGQYDPKRMVLPPNFLSEHPFDHGNLRGRDELLLPFPRTDKDVRDELALYYAVISDLDAQVGRILDALQTAGQADNTIVVFTSDHGLAIGSHGLRGKQNMYEHTIGVPLVFVGPQIPQGRRLDAQCYLRDLFPTVCDLAGIPIPQTIQGRNLAPVMVGKVASVYPFVCGYFRDTQRMIRTEDFKLIYYPQINKLQLFDLRNDPDEITNLADNPRHKQRVAELLARMRTWFKRNGDPLFQ